MNYQAHDADDRDAGRCPLVGLVEAMVKGDEAALSSVYEQTVAQVYGIARAILDHVSLDETKHQALAARLIDERLDPESVLSRTQAGCALHVALRSLTPRRRQLIDLAFFQGLSHQELADAIGMRLGTVKSHLRRALATLQDRLTANE
jgi:RNA polymerase sigma factor (sigma-70 family)